MKKMKGNNILHSPSPIEYGGSAVTGLALLLCGLCVLGLALLPLVRRSLVDLRFGSLHDFSGQIFKPLGSFFAFPQFCFLSQRGFSCFNINFRQFSAASSNVFSISSRGVKYVSGFSAIVIRSVSGAISFSNPGKSVPKKVGGWIFTTQFAPVRSEANARAASQARFSSFFPTPLSRNY